MFAAVLGRHRKLLSAAAAETSMSDSVSGDGGVYFRDEVQYYTDIIRVLVGWIHRAALVYGDSGGGGGGGSGGGGGVIVTADDGDDGTSYYSDAVWRWFYDTRSDVNAAPGSGAISRWLLSYGYLMAGINEIGAEQALCAAFRSLVCFSHKETFYYASRAFAGEAAFRLYRRSLQPRPPQPLPPSSAYGRPPDDGQGSVGVGDDDDPIVVTGSRWTHDPHDRFFPALAACQREIFADVDYSAVGGLYSTACEFPVATPPPAAPAEHAGAGLSPETADVVNDTTALPSPIVDLDLLANDEFRRLSDELRRTLDADLAATVRRTFVGRVLFAVVLLYLAVANSTRCVCVGLESRRRRHRRQRRTNRSDGRRSSSAAAGVGHRRTWKVRRKLGGGGNGGGGGGGSSGDEPETEKMINATGLPLTSSFHDVDDPTGLMTSSSVRDVDEMSGTPPTTTERRGLLLANNGHGNNHLHGRYIPV